MTGGSRFAGAGAARSVPLAGRCGARRAATLDDISALRWIDATRAGHGRRCAARAPARGCSTRRSTSTAEDWWWRTRFDSELTRRSRGARLRRPRDAVPTSWLDGEHVLRSENMFVARGRSRVDVRRRARARDPLRARSHPSSRSKRPRPRWRVPMLEAAAAALVPHDAARPHAGLVAAAVPRSDRGGRCGSSARRVGRSRHRGSARDARRRRRPLEVERASRRRVDAVALIVEHAGRAHRRRRARTTRRRARAARCVSPSRRSGGRTRTASRRSTTSSLEVEPRRQRRRIALGRTGFRTLEIDARRRRFRRARQRRRRVLPRRLLDAARRRRRSAPRRTRARARSRRCAPPA